MEPRVVLMNAGGGTETYERVPDDPENRWQQIQGVTRLPLKDPISADELLERARAVIFGEPGPGRE